MRRPLSFPKPTGRFVLKGLRPSLEMKEAAAAGEEDKLRLSQSPSASTNGSRHLIWSIQVVGSRFLTHPENNYRKK